MADDDVPEAVYASAAVELLHEWRLSGQTPVLVPDSAFRALVRMAYRAGRDDGRHVVEADIRADERRRVAEALADHATFEEMRLRDVHGIGAAAHMPVAQHNWVGGIREAARRAWNKP